MKKSLLCIALGSIGLGAVAQTVVKEFTGGAVPNRFIPGAYMKNGVAALYTSDNEYGYDGAREYKAEIFDFELNPLKTFSFKTLQPYTVVESRATTGDIVKTKEIEREIRSLSSLADVSDMEARKTDFANYLCDTMQEFYYSIRGDVINSATIDGTTIYVPVPIAEDSYYEYSEYLKSIKAYLKADNTYGYIYQYSITVPKCDGEWATSTTLSDAVSNFYTPHCIDVSNLNDWNGGLYLPFSQTFFNNDEKFEYVRYIAEIAAGGSADDPASIWSGDDAKKTLFGITDSDRDGDGVEDYKSTFYGIHYKGFEVVAEDGSVLYTFDTQTTNTNSTIEFYKSDNHILVELWYVWEDESGNNHGATRFYRIDKAAASAPMLLREEDHVTAAPNPASQGTPIVMTLPSESSKARRVSVTSLNGGKVYDQTVAPGVSQVSIPTSNLSSGMYLFMVTEDGRKIDTCKILVK
jgi:hypothetical protein